MTRYLTRAMVNSHKYDSHTEPVPAMAHAYAVGCVQSCGDRPARLFFEPSLSPDDPTVYVFAACAEHAAMLSAQVDRNRAESDPSR